MEAAVFHSSSDESKHLFFLVNHTEMDAYQIFHLI